MFIGLGAFEHGGVLGTCLFQRNFLQREITADSFQQSCALVRVNQQNSGSLVVVHLRSNVPNAPKIAQREVANTVITLELTVFAGGAVDVAANE